MVSAGRSSVRMSGRTISGHTSGIGGTPPGMTVSLGALLLPYRLRRSAWVASVMSRIATPSLQASPVMVRNLAAWPA